jgi:hypothetical protein
MKGMALQVQQGDQWVQLGVRTQNDGVTRRFEALYFEVPEKWITVGQTTFRLVSKTGEEVSVYHLWMYKVEGNQTQALPELLGFASNQDAGEVSHGLIPKGGYWKAPLVLSQHPDQGALIIQKIGKGYLIRSELSLEDSTGLLKTFLKPENLEALALSWPGS